MNLTRAEGPSPVERLVKSGAFDAFWSELSDDERAALEYNWQFWARPEQRVPEGDWSTWFVCAGRGFGKTRTGAESCREMVESGEWRRFAIVGRTAADVRDVMVGGESGILATSPPWFRPRW